MTNNRELLGCFSLDITRRPLSMIFIQITQRAPVGDHIVQAVLKIIPLSRVDRYIHLISHKREWNNCFIKNAQKI